MFQVFLKLVGIMHRMMFLKRVFLLDSMDATSCGDGIYGILNLNCNAIPELT